MVQITGNTIRNATGLGSQANLLCSPENGVRQKEAAPSFPLLPLSQGRPPNQIWGEEESEQSSSHRMKMPHELLLELYSILQNAKE